jgi:hypothetical protein
MRRLIGLTAAFLLVPASVALGTDLEELLERSHEASYSAEQVISCSTPDGVEDAVVRLRQASGEIHVGASIGSDLSVASGYGGWTLLRGDDVVSSALVDSAGEDAEVGYVLDHGAAIQFLGREATRYQMFDGDLLRAELVTDDEAGALLRVTTYGTEGEVYCERRFITFDSTTPVLATSDPTAAEAFQSLDIGDGLPEELAGFTRLDLYADDSGFVFAYYSDGFFSFAVFETPAVVRLADPFAVTFDGRTYDRSFAPGQVTYSWESRDGGMALIGDLPPDMHPAVLEGLPEPHEPGLFLRLWRSLFG